MWAGIRRAATLRVVDSAPLRYVVSLPAERVDDAPLPLLCFLHGFDEAAPHAIRRALTLRGPLRAGSWPGVTTQFIVVAPQLPSAGDLWHRYADDVAAIVSELRRTHGGDASRTYLTGFSFGGNGVLDLAARQPRTWAALWPVDPTRVPPDASAEPVWLSVGEIARRRLDGFVGAMGLRRVEPHESLVDDDRLYTDEGDDHVGCDARSYAEGRTYAWLLRHHLRPTSPAA